MSKEQVAHKILDKLLGNSPAIDSRMKWRGACTQSVNSVEKSFASMQKDGMIETMMYSRVDGD